MADTGKQLVQEQFGDKVAAYTTSAVHARGKSLRRLLELTDPQPAWSILDVATGAGHTALAFAPHVRQVVATDLTFPMLGEVQVRARARDFANVRVATADAEALPLVAGSFDLVTCRLAAHHFPQVACFLQESARVLRAEGLVAVVDNVVPGSMRQNKRGRLRRTTGRYVNAFEQLRDPSHHLCLSLYEWREIFYQAGFAIIHEEVERKEFDFDDYVRRMRVPAEDVARLRAMLVQAPDHVLEFLTPVFDADTIKFCLSEALFVARKTD